jgi:hypothetical protein
MIKEAQMTHNKKLKANVMKETLEKSKILSRKFDEELTLVIF